jgi:hypothetical protein
MLRGRGAAIRVPAISESAADFILERRLLVIRVSSLGLDR